MATILQLVASVGSTTALLDLNATGAGLFRLKMDPEPRFDAPPLRRALAGSLLRDGQRLSSAAYDNRTITCTLQLLGATQGQKQTAMTTLGRLLDTEGTVLRLQFEDASASTWYRLIRSPSYGVRRVRKTGVAQFVDLELLAEPFGLGAAVTGLNAVTVNNDPAAGSNGCFVDVTGVTGDVETQAKILMTSGGQNMAPIISVRRHGIVTDISPYTQAESAATLGTDTTSGADSAMSSGNRARCSFATVAAMATRLTFDFPYSGGFARTAARGIYRIFIIVASSAATNTYAMRFLVQSAFGGAQTMAQGDTVTYTATDTSRRPVSLGILQVPVGPDPVYDGMGDLALVGNVSLQIQAQRVSGSGSLDFDLLAGLPADEEFMETATTYLDIVADGERDAIYTPDGIGAVTGSAVPAIAWNAAIPMLTPNQTNRLYILRPDGVGTGVVRGADVKTRTATMTLTYNPRHLSWVP